MIPFLFRTEAGGRRVLALDSGLRPEAFSKSGRAAAVAETGILVSPGGETGIWQIQGTACRPESGTVFFYGEDFPGEPVLSCLESLYPPDAGTDIHTAAAAHTGTDQGERAALWQKFRNWIRMAAGSPDILRAAAALGPGGILYNHADGRTLLLPPGIFTKCAAVLPEAEEFACRGIWIHPAAGQLPPETAFAFTAGCAARKILCGKMPFILPDHAAQNQEALSRAVAAGAFVPAPDALPGLPPKDAANLDALLSAGNRRPAGGTGRATPEIAAILQNGILETEADGLFRTETAGSPDLQPAENLIRKRFRKEDAVRKYRIPVIAAVIALAAVAGLISVQIENRRNLPTTENLTPREVAAGFYAGIAALRPEVPQAFARGKAAAHYTELTDTLSLSLKMRQALQPGNGWISPALFYAASRRGVPVSGTRPVYGITRLSLTGTGETPQTAEYLASFFLWVPLFDRASGQPAGEETRAAPVTVYRCRDRLHLDFVRDRWLITGIELLEQTVLPVSRMQIEADAAKSAADAESALPCAPDPDSIAEARRTTGFFPAAAD